MTTTTTPAKPPRCKLPDQDDPTCCGHGLDPSTCLFRFGVAVMSRPVSPPCHRSPRLRSSKTPRRRVMPVGLPAEARPAFHSRVVEVVGNSMAAAGLSRKHFYRGTDASYHGPDSVWTRRLVARAGSYEALEDLLTAGWTFWEVLELIGMDAAVQAIQGGAQFDPDADWAQVPD